MNQTAVVRWKRVQPALMPLRMPYPYLYPLSLDFAMNCERSSSEQPSAPLLTTLCLAQFTPTRVEGYQLSAKTQCGHPGNAATHLHKCIEAWLGPFELCTYHLVRSPRALCPPTMCSSFLLQGFSAIVHLGRTGTLAAWLRATPLLRSHLAEIYSFCVQRSISCA